MNRIPTGFLVATALLAAIPAATSAAQAQGTYPPTPEQMQQQEKQDIQNQNNAIQQNLTQQQLQQQQNQLQRQQLFNSMPQPAYQAQPVYTPPPPPR